MDGIGHAITSLPFLTTPSAQTAALSAATVVVGYGTYLLAYYAGMLFKERKDFINDGHIDSKQLKEKWKIIKADFLGHLPSDAITMPLMGTTQGTFLAMGILPQFWAIFATQAIADLIYTLKEPFFWHGAKKYVEWRNAKQLKEDESNIVAV